MEKRISMYPRKPWVWVMMVGCCCAEGCTAAVLIGVMRLPGCPFGSAWCLVCEVCRLG